MEYIYAVLLLHKAGKEVNEESLKAVLQAAGVNVDEAKVKAVVAALEGVKIDEVLEKAQAPVAVAAAPAAGGSSETKEEKKEEPKKEEKKKDVDAAAGLAALFG
jgi:large subunit ribosomal protein L12